MHFIYSANNAHVVIELLAIVVPILICHFPDSFRCSIRCEIIIFDQTRAHTTHHLVAVSEHLDMRAFWRVSSSRFPFIIVFIAEVDFIHQFAYFPIEHNSFHFCCSDAIRLTSAGRTNTSQPTFFLPFCSTLRHSTLCSGPSLIIFTYHRAVTDIIFLFKHFRFFLSNSSISFVAHGLAHLMRTPQFEY